MKRKQSVLQKYHMFKCHICGRFAHFLKSYYAYNGSITDLIYDWFLGFAFWELRKWHNCHDHAKYRDGLIITKEQALVLISKLNTE